ncbi:MULTISPECIES: anti-sigma F factor [Clostridiaceae]|uniref:anti-sigma F factor n=1 Tax=Clostridiaceae TaxID=31979 RepID=UPI00085BCA56|nr:MULTISPECIES: anti-sigma F factor [Clostridiaceae]
MIENEMKLTIPSHSSNESFARIAVAGFFAQLDPTIDEIADIKTAVSEAVTNAIVHGYGDKIGLIHIRAQIHTDNKVVIRIRDTGCGIADIEQAMEPMYTTCKNGERSGLGFSVMQTFMDKVKVNSTQGKGTTVVLTKKLKSRNHD